MTIAINNLLNAANKLLLSFSEAVYVTNRECEIIWVNNSFKQTFGWNLSEINNSIFIPHYLSEEHTELKRKIRFGGNIYGHQSSRISRDGTLIPVIIDFLPIYSDTGLVEGYSVTLKDGSKQIKLEEEIIKTNEKYELIANNTSDMIFLVDQAGIVRFVSPSIKSVLGYKQEEYEGLSAFSILHPDDREFVNLSNQYVFEKNKPIQLQYKAIHKNGSIVEIESRVMPARVHNQEAEYSVVVARDITERKKRENQLEYITNDLNATIWSTENFFKTFSFCSPSVEKVTGISMNNIMNEPLLLFKKIDPDYLKSTELFNIDCYLEKDILVGEFPIKHPEGRQRWIRYITMPIKDSCNQIIRIDGIFLDVTLYKSYETKILLTENRYKALFDNHIDGVFTLDLSGRLLSSNKSFNDILGIPTSQNIGINFKEYIVGGNESIAKRTFVKVIASKKSLQIELEIKNQAGKRLTLNVTFIPIIQDDKTIGIHGIVKDITEIKKNSIEIINSKDRYRLLQSRLNQFSQDLKRVMKISDLEQRLITEVKNVLGIDEISIIDIHGSDKNVNGVNFGKIIYSEDCLYIKIAQRNENIFLLKINNTSRKEINQNEIIWLETISHYVTLLYENLYCIEDLCNQLANGIFDNQSPQWLLRLLFNLSEKERQNLSSDLHDSALQVQIVWYRRLEQLLSGYELTEEIRMELEQIAEGLLDVIHQIRLTCTELRPPLLKEMGLSEAIQSLIAHNQLQSNYKIHYSNNHNNYINLNEEQMIGIYRVVQELLNNATKHSQATAVHINIRVNENHLTLRYQDNGVGLDINYIKESFQHLGIIGIKKRIESMDGSIEFSTAYDQGLHVSIKLPI